MQAARELGVRIVASRGSMDLGESDGGLPPDELVEELDARARRHRAACRRAARAGAGCARPDRRCALLAVLGHETADAGVGVARTAPRPAAAYPSRRDDGGGRVLPGALRLHARRVPDRPRLARLGRVVRALRPPLRRRRRRLRGEQHGDRALPHVEPPPGGGRRARSRAPGRAAFAWVSASTARRRTSGATCSWR